MLNDPDVLNTVPTVPGAVPFAGVAKLDVLITTPRMVGVDPPMLMMFPFPTAVVVVIAETACVVTVGNVATATVVNAAPISPV